MARRLPGHVFRVGDGVLIIDDVLGHGRPWVGHVLRAGADLVLLSGGRKLKLVGALARPRIVGPGYWVWAVGAIRGDTLTLAHVGVLAAPTRPAPPRGEPRW